MKGKKIMYYVIAAAALIVLGVGITGLGKALGGSSNGILGINKTKDEGWKVTTGNVVEGTVFIDDFDELVLNTSSVDIIIEEGTDFAFTYCVFEGQEPKVTQSGSKLKIEQPSNIVSVDLFAYGPEGRYYKLTVPEDVKIDVEIESSSGEIDINSVDMFGSVSSSSGSIKIANVIGDDLDVTASSGSIRVETSRFDKLIVKATSGDVTTSISDTHELSLTTSSGTIKVDRTTADDTFLKSTSGSIKAEEFETDSVKVETTSGSVNLECDEVDSVKCKSTSGSVTLELPGSKDDYSYDLSCTSGTIKVGNDRSDHSYSSKNGGKPVEVQTTSGNIHIQF